jgi:hypothetical protein
MRTHRILMLLPILLGLCLACSHATPAAVSPAANSTTSTGEALPGTTVSPQAQTTLASAASPVPTQQKGTIDGLVAGTLTLRSVKISLSTTQPDGSVNNLNAEIDANGNQHLVKTYPESSTPLFENGAPNPPTTLEMYVLNGVAYAPDKNGIFRPADAQSMTATLQNALLSPEGPAFWLKVLPMGSLSPQGNEEIGGFAATKYIIQGKLDQADISGSLWVTPDKQTLLAAEIDVPASQAGPQTKGTLKIRFHVEKADIAPIQPETAPALPTETASPSQPTQAETTGPSLVDSFPLAPGTSLDRSNLSEPEPGDRQGYFTLLTTNTTVTKLADFYENELSKLGWTLRYSDNNYQGGLTQYWKQSSLYLTLEFLYQDDALVAKARYERIDPAAAQNLPQGFPLPPQAELVSASDTSWTYYVPQELTQVTTFLDQKFQALGWTQGTVMGGFGGECGGDCGGGASYPAGVTPMPAPTLDPRPSKYYAYVTPNGDDINLEARPHQNATILVIDLTVKQAAAAGLPPDVSLYPDAQIQMASPGMVLYQTSASVETLKQYYLDSLTASGWQLDGDPFESGGVALYRYKKGNLSLQITLAPNGASSSSVSIACDGCT